MRARRPGRRRRRRIFSLKTLTQVMSPAPGTLTIARPAASIVLSYRRAAAAARMLRLGGDKVNIVALGLAASRCFASV